MPRSRASLLDKTQKKQAIQRGDRSHQQLCALDRLVASIVASGLTFPGWQAVVEQAEVYHVEDPGLCDTFLSQMMDQYSDALLREMNLKRAQVVHRGDCFHPRQSAAPSTRKRSSLQCELEEQVASGWTHPGWNADTNEAEINFVTDPVLACDAGYNNRRRIWLAQRGLTRNVDGENSPSPSASALGDSNSDIDGGRPWGVQPNLYYNHHFFAANSILEIQPRPDAALASPVPVSTPDSTLNSNLSMRMEGGGEALQKIECDFCLQRKIKCSGEKTCRQCRARNHACTYSHCSTRPNIRPTHAAQSEEVQASPHIPPLMAEIRGQTGVQLWKRSADNKGSDEVLRSASKKARGAGTEELKADSSQDTECLAEDGAENADQEGQQQKVLGQEERPSHLGGAREVPRQGGGGRGGEWKGRLEEALRKADAAGALCRELQELGAELTEREAKLEEGGAKLEEREAELGQRRDQLAEEEAALTERKSALALLEQRQSQLEEMGAKRIKRDAENLKTREEKLEKRGDELIKREAKVEERKEKLEESERQLEEQRAVLKERGDTLEEEKERLEEREARLEKREAEQEERIGHLGEKEAVMEEREFVLVLLEEREDVLEERGAKLVERGEELEERESELAERRKELEQRESETCSQLQHAQATLQLGQEVLSRADAAESIRRTRCSELEDRAAALEERQAKLAGKEAEMEAQRVKLEEALGRLQPEVVDLTKEEEAGGRAEQSGEGGEAGGGGAGGDGGEGSLLRLEAGAGQRGRESGMALLAQQQRRILQDVTERAAEAQVKKERDEAVEEQHEEGKYASLFIDLQQEQLDGLRGLCAARGIPASDVNAALQANRKTRRTATAS